MNIIRMHNMDSRTEAIHWVDAKLTEMMGELGDQISDGSSVWVDNVLKFRFRVRRLARFSGTLTVTRDCLHLHLPFPLPFPLLARSREGAAQVVLEKWLDENLPPA